MKQKSWNMTETLAHGYSSESIQWELSNEYQWQGFKIFASLCFVQILEGFSIVWNQTFGWNCAPRFSERILRSAWPTLRDWSSASYSACSLLYFLCSSWTDLLSLDWKKQRCILLNISHLKTLVMDAIRDFARTWPACLLNWQFPKKKSF